MSGSVKKIFMVLITVVACVLIGALVLNVLLPNVATTMVDATEGMIFRASGIAFDFNSNGRAGGTETRFDGNQQDGNIEGGNVEGFR